MAQINEPSRGTGRTTAQLAALPAGGVYLVHSSEFACYCKRLLQAAGRDPNEIRFVTPRQVRSIDGIRFERWDVDHAYWDGCGRGGAFAFAFDLLRAASAMSPA